MMAGKTLGFGVDQAITDINAAGGVAGHPLKIITVDTQSKFTNGTSGAQQAIEKGAKLAPIEQDMVARLRLRDDGGLRRLLRRLDHGEGAA